MTQFEYLDKVISKGDAVAFTQNVAVNDIYNDMSITSSLINDLTKLGSIGYVDNRVGNTISILPKKGKTVKPIGKTSDESLPTYFPIDLFKVVKVPKMNDLVNWLYDNQPIIYPLQFKPFKNEINYLVRYILEIFQTSPQALYLASKNCNRLYFNDDDLETLMFYKSLVQGLKLNFYDRYNQFNKQNKRKQFIDIIKTLNKEWHTNDIISLWELNRHAVIPGDYISNEDRIDFFKNPAKERAYNKSQTENIKKLIREREILEQENKLKNDTRFLSNLTQELIDELELVIFNVKTIRSQNKILFIFIDKDNLKRFYLQPFNFNFYISSNIGIINNDYIVELTENHLQFNIQSFEVLSKLKFAVNNNYKNFMKRGRF